MWIYTVSLYNLNYTMNNSFLLSRTDSQLEFFFYILIWYLPSFRYFTAQQLVYKSYTVISDQIAKTSTALNTQKGFNDIFEHLMLHGHVPSLSIHISYIPVIASIINCFIETKTKHIHFLINCSMKMLMQSYEFRIQYLWPSEC